MSDYFIGEIRLFAFPWAPRDWALCDGRVMQVTQNQALFSLIHNAYGGDGVKTFQLPDFRGRTSYGQSVPATATSTYVVGNTAGAETVAITAATMPVHNHVAAAVSTISPTSVNLNKGGAVFAQAANAVNLYAPPQGTSGVKAVNAATLGSTGGGQPHQNMQPFAVVNFCIALLGLYPTRP